MADEEQWVEVELAADAEAPARARAAVDRVTAAIAGDVGFRARLAASELVANSVAHAASSSDDCVRVTVLGTGAFVRVEVQDSGAAFDSDMRLISDQATSGRGLRLVDALVDRWGSEHRDGNLVWFEIDRPAGGEQDPRSKPASGKVATPVTGDPMRASAPHDRAHATAVLARAAERIREGWCQRRDALDASGEAVAPWDARAAAWSLAGAVVAAIDGPAAAEQDGLPLQGFALALAALAELIEDRSLAGWNDAPNRTQAQVIAVLERARMLLLHGRVLAARSADCGS